LLSACWRYLEEAAGRGFEAIAPYIALLAMLTLRPHGLFGQSRVERIELPKTPGICLKKFPECK